MTANQTNAKEFNPNSLDLTLVAQYQRTIAAPSERVWENVLDWEHLPWLHKTSFDFVELDAAGDWGWRTWSTPEHNAHVELIQVDHESYVARSYNANNQISEIWTRVTPGDDTTHIAVDFYFPDVDEERSNSLREAILSLYIQLWDEDEAMMIARHHRLTEKRNQNTDITIGDAAVINAKLCAGESVIFQVAGQEYKLAYVNGMLEAQATVCPHLSGPLERSPTNSNRLFCPWHGYQFDIQTGQCVFPASANCRLKPAPKITTSNGKVLALSIV